MNMIKSKVMKCRRDGGLGSVRIALNGETLGQIAKFLIFGCK